MDLSVHQEDAKPEPSIRQARSEFQHRVAEPVMNNSNELEHCIILASTLFGVAVGYLLSRPRQSTAPPDRARTRPDQASAGQAGPSVKPPRLIAPLSSTVH